MGCKRMENSEKIKSDFGGGIQHEKNKSGAKSVRASGLESSEPSWNAPYILYVHMSYVYLFICRIYQYIYI